MKRSLISTAGATAALISLFALTACGGGGGGNTDSPVAPPPTPTPAPIALIADAGNLQVSVPTPTYAAGSGEADAFSTMNALRLAAGAGLVSQSAQMDIATSAHAKYIATNIAGLQDYHNQDAAKADFYARSVGDRLTKAGVAWSNLTEVIGGTGPSRKASDCVKGLLNTVYHGAAILSSNVNVGVSMGRDAANVPMCVVDFSTAADDKLGQVPAAGKFIGYPHGGQADVDGTYWISFESPRPSSSLFVNNTAGTPVIVSLRNADYLNFGQAGTLNPVITTFTLKDAGGNKVPAAILANSKLIGAGVTLNPDSLLADGFAVLVPLAPLPEGQTYTVDFSATLKAGAAPLAKTWTFSTKASSPAGQTGGSNGQSNSSAGQPSNSGQTPGVGMFAFDNHTRHTSNGSIGDQIVITVRNVGPVTIENASLVCSGASFFGGVSGQTLPPGGTLSTICVAGGSGGYSAAQVKALGTNAANSGVVFGPY